MKLKPGQYSRRDPCDQPDEQAGRGIPIVKLISKEPAGQRELADPRVQQAIRTQLRDRREQLLKAAYYEVLRDQARGRKFLCAEGAGRQRHSSVKVL